MSKTHVATKVTKRNLYCVVFVCVSFLTRRYVYIDTISKSIIYWNTLPYWKCARLLWMISITCICGCPNFPPEHRSICPCLAHRPACAVAVRVPHDDSPAKRPLPSAPYNRWAFDGDSAVVSAWRTHRHDRSNVPGGCARCLCRRIILARGQLATFLAK